MSIAHALRFLGDTVVLHGAADPASDRESIGLAVIDTFRVPIHDLPNLDINDIAALGCAYATREAHRA